MSASDFFSGPNFFVVGANHLTAPLEIREKLALTSDRLAAFQSVAERIDGLRELAVLNTCNRVEIYGVAESGAVIDRLQAEYCAACDLPPEQLAAVRYFAGGADAIAHLLAVASGLESQMLGENEIFGQVKTAYQTAQDRRTVGAVLNRVFQKAFQGAKYIRTHTAITVGQVSIANVAVDLALTIFGDLRSARVLLLGAGDIGEKTAVAFQSRGVESLTVASRTLVKAMELATRFGAVALPFEHMPVHLHEFDIVVCSTAAPAAVVTHFAATTALRRRPAQPLFFIDLALPRDVEPNVAQLENAFVYNLDDLARIAEDNRAAREAEVSKARALVAGRAQAIWRQVALPAAAPTKNVLPNDPTMPIATQRIPVVGELPTRATET